ncbi:hypothetical protein SAMN05216199_0661 [Pedococcus cremeus]|uniref:Uncharacterized protein n=1 Tax=Pedococcus cremeus TaxID=587636 RepID=A0A1H9QK44_9MICO|nr:hypothetical protein [Pedococcus cremeus]SER60832.1 hypothetical protein SAMN05216199_0661 [Pedococcus cremeus]
MIRKTLLTAATTVGLLATGIGAASAHECYIANRSAQGNAGASHSANWYTLQMSDLFAEAHLFFGGEPLTDAQLAWALEQTKAQGIPLSVTMFEKFTIPRSVEKLEGLSTKSSDGKGVDHFFSRYGDALFQIFSAAQAR